MCCMNMSINIYINRKEQQNFKNSTTLYGELIFNKVIKVICWEDFLLRRVQEELAIKCREEKLEHSRNYGNLKMAHNLKILKYKNYSKKQVKILINFS